MPSLFHITFSKEKNHFCFRQASGMLLNITLTVYSKKITLIKTH